MSPSYVCNYLYKCELCLLSTPVQNTRKWLILIYTSPRVLPQWQNRSDRRVQVFYTLNWRCSLVPVFENIKESPTTINNFVNEADF